MLTSNVVQFSENIPTMTFEEGLAFIERTRGQLYRFEVAFPSASGEHIPFAAKANVTWLLSELEPDIRAKIEGI